MIKFLNRHFNAKWTEFERNELRARQDKLHAENARLYERIGEWHKHSAELCGLVLELRRENDELRKQVLELRGDLETAEKAMKTMTQAVEQFLFELEQLKKEQTQAPEIVK